VTDARDGGCSGPTISEAVDSQLIKTESRIQPMGGIAASMSQSLPGLRDLVQSNRERYACFGQVSTGIRE